MHRVDIAIVDGTTRIPLAAWRGVASFGFGEHGMESASAQIPLERWAAFLLFTRLSASLWLRVTGGGAMVWEGRIEDISIADQGATVQALGRWRALRDTPYTALWSDTQLTRWREATSADRASRTPERYGFDKDNRLVIYPKSGQSYNTSRIGTFVYEPPDGGSRDILAIQCMIEHQLPNATWQVRVGRIAGTIAAGTFTTITTINGTGALGQVALHATWVAAGDTYLVIEILFNSGVLTAYAGTDGDHFVRVTDLRVTSATAGRITTVLTAGRAAGASVTASVGSTAGMYVGMQLVVNSGAATSEIVTVESITSGTQFVATFVNAYVAGTAVQGLRVTADEIVRSLRDATNNVNSGALSSSNALIQSPGLDLLDQVYEDADIGDIMTELAAFGDSSGNRYEVGVDGSTLYFRPVGDAAQAWYVDASELQVQQTLDQLYNSVYATYQRADGFTLRTASQPDSASITRYGLARRRAIPADTSNATLAVRVAQTARDDSKNPIPRASLQFARVYTATGAQAPLWLVRNGDTITIRNLPPVAGAAVDLIRTFRVFDCDYDAAEGRLSVTPETPLPLLEYLLARQAAFGDVAAGRLVGRR